MTNINISQSIEKERGCGFRKKGGLYLVGGRFGSPCGKLPIPLTVCPCCNQGIKQSRGFSWITIGMLKAEGSCHVPSCGTCPLNLPAETQVGLMWIGEKFYPTPDHFTREGNVQGISKRLAQIPKDLEVGKTWVMLAHPKAIRIPKKEGEATDTFQAGIFQAFIPERVEYIVKGDESQEELERLVKRGITLIDVVPEKKAQMALTQNWE